MKIEPVYSKMADREIACQPYLEPQNDQAWYWS